MSVQPETHMDVKSVNMEKNNLEGKKVLCGLFLKVG